MDICIDTRHFQTTNSFRRLSLKRQNRSKLASIKIILKRTIWKDLEHNGGGVTSHPIQKSGDLRRGGGACLEDEESRSANKDLPSVRAPVCLA